MRPKIAAVEMCERSPTVSTWVCTAVLVTPLPKPPSKRCVNRALPTTCVLPKIEWPTRQRPKVTTPVRKRSRSKAEPTRAGPPSRVKSKLSRAAEFAPNRSIQDYPTILTHTPSLPNYSIHLPSFKALWQSLQSLQTASIALAPRPRTTTPNIQIPRQNINMVNISPKRIARRRALANLSSRYRRPKAPTSLTLPT